MGKRKYKSIIQYIILSQKWRVDVSKCFSSFVNFLKTQPAQGYPFSNCANIHCYYRLHHGGGQEAIAGRDLKLRFPGLLVQASAPVTSTSVVDPMLCVCSWLTPGAGSRMLVFGRPNGALPGSKILATSLLDANLPLYASVPRSWEGWWVLWIPYRSGIRIDRDDAS